MPCHWTRDARKTNDGEDAASGIVMTNNFVLVGAHRLLILKNQFIKPPHFQSHKKTLFTQIFTQQPFWRGGRDGEEGG